MKSILQREFKYTNSVDSAKPNYLKHKFDRIKRERAAKAEAEKAKPVNVRQIKEGKK